MYAHISDPDGRRRIGMRTELYQWMKSLAFFHVLTTALLHILPDKRYEQYIRLFYGVSVSAFDLYTYICRSGKK